MNSPRSMKRIKSSLFAIALLCPLLLINSVCMAQAPPASPSPTPPASPSPPPSTAVKLTISPPSVDPAKPQDVEIIVRKTDDSIDTVAAGQVARVKVGGLPPVNARKDAQGKITITPPPGLAGLQPIQLLDAQGNTVNDVEGKPLAAQLIYGAANGPTPDSEWVRKNNEEVRKNQVVHSNWYFPLIIVGFLALMGAFVFVIVKGILRSRATFRTPTGLPIGSFRAMLAYTLVAFLGFYVLASLLTVSNVMPPDFLLGIVATVIGFYFGSRSGEEGLMDGKTGIVRGTVKKGTKPVSGALVKFKSSDGKEPYSRITDVEGRFELIGAKEGTYTVTASTTSPKATGKQEVTVSEGSDHEIEIVLTGGGAPPPGSPPPGSSPP